MSVVDWSVNKLQFWAVLDTPTGEVLIELQHVQLDYALNTIPSAVLYCAIGRDVRSLIVANIHFLVDDLKINLPITVYAEADEIENSGVSGGFFPAGPFIVFDGRVVGTQYTKSMTGVASLQLVCRNFLMDLEYSLTNTKTTHAKNIGHGGLNAGIKVNQDTPDFTIQTTAKKFFVNKNLTQDFWGSALQPWLSNIIDLPAVFEGEDISEGQGATDALDALDRIEPGDLVGGEYSFSEEMPLHAFPIVALKPAIQAIATDVSHNTFRSFTGTTIWEKLTQEFASKYHFAVVPMANRALVVPFVPGLRDIWVTIDPSEYETVWLKSDIPRALRGVVVYTGMNSLTGGQGFQQGQAGAIRTVGGKYENDNIDPGMFIFREGPVWLSNPVSASFWGKLAAGVNQVIGNVINPGAGQGPQDGIQPKDVRIAAEPMWDAFAHSLYLREALQYRLGSISGRMRFDIAPGSSIELITTEEKFVAEATGIKDQSLFGMVTRVTIVASSEAVDCRTNIEFAYMRNPIENDTDFGTDSHPLYDSTFSGAPLCEEQPVG